MSSICAVAFVFIGASIFTMLTCKTCSPFIDYEKSLDVEQLEVYKQVVLERQKIYLHGLCLGAILAFCYLYFTGQSINPLTNSCIFVAIALFTQYCYYMLYPKSEYMVTLMKNKDQLQKWQNVNKHMQYRYHLGMVFGVIGYFLLSYGLQQK
jgi:uncharacterized protein YacL